MPRTYQPGSRKPGRYSDGRWAWTRNFHGQYVIFVGDKSNETGQDVVFYVPRPGKIPDLAIGLTDLSINELDNFKDLIDTAIEWARPVCELRDKEAEIAYENGDDSYIRSYRPVSELVYRKRPSDEYYQSLRERLERVSQGEWRDESGDDGVRRNGDELAEHGEAPALTEDDHPTTD